MMTCELLFQLALVLDEWKVANVILITPKGLEEGPGELPSLICMLGKFVRHLAAYSSEVSVQLLEKQVMSRVSVRVLWRSQRAYRKLPVNQ